MKKKLLILLQVLAFGVGSGVASDGKMSKSCWKYSLGILDKYADECTEDCLNTDYCCMPVLEADSSLITVQPTTITTQPTLPKAESKLILKLKKDARGLCRVIQEEQLEFEKLKAKGEVNRDDQALFKNRQQGLQHNLDSITQILDVLKTTATSEEIKFFEQKYSILLKNSNARYDFTHGFYKFSQCEVRNRIMQRWHKTK